MTERRTPAEQDHLIDSAILDMLVCSDNQRPWSVDEVERQIGKEAIDGLNRLYGAGLIHRLDGFVWASRAAVVAQDLIP